MKNTENLVQKALFPSKIHLKNPKKSPSHAKNTLFFMKSPRNFPKWAEKRAIFKEKGGYPHSNQRVKASNHAFNGQ